MPIFIPNIKKQNQKLYKLSLINDKMRQDARTPLGKRQMKYWTETDAIARQKYGVQLVDYLERGLKEGKPLPYLASEIGTDYRKLYELAKKLNIKIKRKQNPKEIKKELQDIRDIEELDVKDTSCLSYREFIDWQAIENRVKQDYRASSLPAYLLYEHQFNNQSLSDLSLKLGVDNNSLKRAMVKLQIPLIDYRSKRKKKDYSSKRNHLIKRYWHEGLTLKEIAKEEGVSQQAIWQRMENLGIKRRIPTGGFNEKFKAYWLEVERRVMSEHNVCLQEYVQKGVGEGKPFIYLASQLGISYEKILYFARKNRIKKGQKQKSVPIKRELNDIQDIMELDIKDASCLAYKTRINWALIENRVKQEYKAPSLPAYLIYEHQFNGKSLLYLSSELDVDVGSLKRAMVELGIPFRDYRKSPQSKGKTWEELYGQEKAREMKAQLGAHTRGKTYEELCGVKRAKKLRAIRSRDLCGRPCSEETRRKISESRKQRYVNKKSTLN